MNTKYNSEIDRGDNMTGYINYKNKHNGRIVSLVETKITDTGNQIHKLKDLNDGVSNWTSNYDLHEHWESYTDACDTHSKTSNTSEEEE
tara:strand:+ start:359 stop:625 length:267 start_codon:yes stop_codon:yes gene_type:complete